MKPIFKNIMKHQYKTNGGKYKLAVLASHPIQYQAPFYKLLSNESVDLTVLFCSEWGLKSYKDTGFGKEVKWDVPLLEGYKYKFLKNISSIPNVSKFFGLINLEIIDELKNNNYDAIWIHGWSSFTNWLAMITAFQLNVPVLMRGETNLLPQVPFWKNTLKKNILKWLFKRVSGFLSIGKYNAEFYEDYEVPKEKIFLVPYIVNNDFFISKANELTPKKFELKKKYGLPKNLPVILFSGKLIGVKRPIDLLKAYEIVSKDVESSLVYLGDGKLRNEIEVYIKAHNLKNVYLMGFKNQTELPELYAMADVFVLPSDFEPWGLVINEAMCFGLPVIISDQIGAGGDLVKDGKNGYVYSSGEINELSDKLKTLLNNNDLREAFGKNSREIISRWSYEEDVKGIEQCFKYLKKY